MNRGGDISVCVYVGEREGGGGGGEREGGRGEKVIGRCYSASFADGRWRHKARDAGSF